APPVEAPVSDGSSLEDTQPGAIVEVPPWYDERAYEAGEEPRRRRPRRRVPTGCIAVAGVLLALLAGMVVSAFALTDGDPLSLMRALTPIFDFEPGEGGGVELDFATSEPGESADVGETSEAPTEPVFEPGGPPILPAPASGARFAFTSN